MSIPFQPSAYLAFDYKSSGDYFLPLLQAGFPYPCLQAPCFEDLVDELAGEMADSCFQRLANYIAGDDLGLWKMGFGEDTTYISVVPHAYVEQFKLYWSGPFKQDPDFEYHTVPRLRLVAASKDAAPAAPGKAKRPSLVEDIYPCEAMLELDIDRPVCLVWEAHTDKTKEGRFVDFSVWPPKELPVPDMREDRRFVAEWRPLYQRAERRLWQQRVRDDGIGVHESRFRLVQLDRIAPWSPVFLGGGTVLADAYFNSKVTSSAVLHVSETAGSKGKVEYQVVRIGADSCDTWHTSRKPLQLYPFPDSGRCLVVEGQERMAIVEGPFGAGDFFRLPKQMHGYESNVITLADDVIVYFTDTKSAVRMNWLDPNTMRHQSALLKGFGNHQTVDGAEHATFGNLQVCQGHDNWWILNHCSNQFGSNDIAMFWNAQTGQAFKIEARDMPRQHPTIMYVRALGRYVALDHRSVSLMVHFDQIIAGREMIEVAWETA
jgi:hypothetical protein